MIKLPKVYEVNENTPERYKKYEGKPKVSYSAIGSFKEEVYRGEFFATYFLGKRGDGNVFTAYGSACGGYFETASESEGLSEFDIEVLNGLERPENAVYEREIVLDRGDYCIHGFIDREYKNEESHLILDDLKTGAISSKKALYAGEEYQQTTLYAHARALEGETIAYSGVILLDRKGNGQEKYPLRLTGEVERIPTPYSPERAEEFLKTVDKTVLEIAEYYRVFEKYLK